MEDAAGTAVPAVNSAREKNKGFRIVVTGHSPGGAVAVLLGTRLRNNNMEVDIVSVSFWYV